MIASLFRKSTPFNYTLLIVVVILFYAIYAFTQDANLAFTGVLEKAFLLGIVFAGLFIVNFIVKKNALSRDNSYTILFYFLFLLFFPSTLDNFTIALSNFFILLALRRLVSLHSAKAQKEKIFDASLWVFVAALFHFWSILFIVLVFLSVFFHVSRDYRNWILPFIAFIAVALLFFFFALVIDPKQIDTVFQGSAIDWRFDYFDKPSKNLAISLYAPVFLFFVASMLMSLSNRPLNLHASYKKILFALFIGAAVLLISPNKSNDLLIFTFAPLAILASTHVESTESKLQREITVGLVFVLAMVCFFLQL